MEEIKNQFIALLDECRKSIGETNQFGLLEKDLMKEKLRRMYSLVDRFEARDETEAIEFEPEVAPEPAVRDSFADIEPVGEPAGEHSVKEDLMLAQDEVHFEPEPPVIQQDYVAPPVSETVPETVPPLPEPVAETIPEPPVTHPEPSAPEPPAQPTHTYHPGDEWKYYESLRPKADPKPEPPAPVQTDLFGASTIADRFRENGQSLKDRISGGKEEKAWSENMNLKPISDLKTVIGINEKFQFINELFEGSLENYGRAIQVLNNSGSSEDALNALTYLQQQYEWDMQADAFRMLKELVVRRYLSHG